MKRLTSEVKLLLLFAILWAVFLYGIHVGAVGQAKIDSKKPTLNEVAEIIAALPPNQHILYFNQKYHSCTCEEMLFPELEDVK